MHYQVEWDDEDSLYGSLKKKFHISVQMVWSGSCAYYNTKFWIEMYM